MNHINYLFFLCLITLNLDSCDIRGPERSEVSPTIHKFLSSTDRTTVQVNNCRRIPSQAFQMGSKVSAGVAHHLLMLPWIQLNHGLNLLPSPRTKKATIPTEIFEESNLQVAPGLPPNCFREAVFQGHMIHPFFMPNTEKTRSFFIKKKEGKSGRSSSIFWCVQL